MSIVPPTHPLSTESPAASSRDPGPQITAPLAAALAERYEIVRETGRGASAIVFLARDLKHERLVALKTLNPDVGPVAGDRFLREIQVAAGMQHPHILPMYDSGVADGRLYFVMPFVDGGSLRQRLDAEPQLPIGDALQCTHDIALALAFAHDQGVVHRDIKPENILFYHGHACLADFGVARVMQEIDVRVTGHGMVVGTPAYMSPEQLTDGGFDGRSDVYSLACVLYEMIAGVHAFSGSTPRELLEQRLRTVPEPLHRHRPDVPQFVDDLLLRALARSPLDRFPDARAFADAIEFAQRDLATPRRVSGPRRAIESVPRHPMAWAGSVAIVLAAGALAATPIRTAMRNRGLPGTGSARAAYSAGLDALAKWDLAAAERHLTAATTTDPRFAEAQLRLAQTLELERRVDSDGYRLAAARLAPLRNTLHGRDSLLAAATLALAARAYPQACGAFQRMRAADSLDAMAWYGLGDCLALDSLVLTDAGSPSRLRFRTGWHTAAHAYMRAATIEPLAHRALSFALLSTLLPTTPIRVRIGRNDASPPTFYAAHPSLIADTVAYVPFTLAEIAAATPRVQASTEPDALDRNRAALVDFGRAWVTAAPNNADAYEALAAGLEARGELADAGAMVRRARTLAETPAHQLRLASTEVRIDLKRGDLVAARTRADSLLLAPSNRAPAPADAEWLAGLAALTGRGQRAAELRAIAHRDDAARDAVPAQVESVADQLFMRAALGVCDDSLAALRGAVDALLDSYSPPARRAAARQAALGRAMALAFPCLHGRALDGLTPSLALDRAERAMANGNASRARAILDSAQLARAGMRPGDVALDFTVQEAWLRAAIGDTAAAIRQLDLVLNALPTLGPFAAHEEAQAAAMGRALALRAELAAAQHDTAQRRRRASEVLALWQHADASLAPIQARMRALAAATP